MSVELSAHVREEIDRWVAKFPPDRKRSGDALHARIPQMDRRIVCRGRFKLAVQKDQRLVDGAAFKIEAPFDSGIVDADPDRRNTPLGAGADR